MTGQVGHTHPGQDEKAGVVRHGRQMALARRGIPADPGIARAAGPGRSTEQQASHRLAVAAVRDILHGLAHGVAQAQVVIGAEQATKQPVLVAGVFNAGDLQRRQVLQRSGDRLAAMGDPKRGAVAVAVGGLALPRR